MDCSDELKIASLAGEPAARLDYANAGVGRHRMRWGSYLDRFLAAVIGAVMSLGCTFVGIAMVVDEHPTRDWWRMVATGCVLALAGLAGLAASVRQLSRHVRHGLFWPPNERGAPIDPER